MATRTPPVRKQGDYPQSAPWGSEDDAQAYEERIAAEAAEVRGEGYSGLTVALFLRLWPLLSRHLHPGHVIHTTSGKGKPYESDGAKSAQVLIDRMNNVLTPLSWDYSEQYEDGGKLCKVTIAVHDRSGVCLVSRSSWGGVNQGSTQGNIYKGSFTNAAKLAFARLGPGHEIYLGVVDMDPDVNPDIAKQQAKQSTERAAASKPASSESDARTVTPEAALAELLAEGHPLQAKRKKADDGMEILGAPARQRLAELQACPDERSIDGLIGRIDAALDQQGDEN